MNITDFAYVVDTNKEFEDAVVSALKSVEKKGWTVFAIYDLKERLAAKGFEHNKMKIIEICSAKYADKFLKKDSLVSLCMPCKINVIEDKGKVKIAGMKPSTLSQFFNEIKPEETAEVESELKEMVDNAR